MLGRASGNGIEPGEEFMLDRLMQAYTYTYTKAREGQLQNQSLKI